MSETGDVMKRVWKSRMERSTAAVYDAEYAENWKKRFKTTHDPNDERVRFECTKKSEHLEKLLHMERGALLDIGANTGMFVHHMIGRGWMAAGLEVSPDAVALCPSNISGLMKVGSVTDMPFDDALFDVTTAYDVMEHLYIEQIYQAIAEITRVTRKAFVMRVPVDGYLCEGGIPDLQLVSNDQGHVGIYSWEFWARRFRETKQWTLLNCVLWECQSAPGDYMEAWITFVKEAWRCEQS